MIAPPIHPRAVEAIGRAAAWVAAGRRLDLQGLADELGVSRVTLFRRVGNREAVLGEALWLLTSRTLRAATARWQARRPAGATLADGVGRSVNSLVARSSGLRQLLDDEPALAIRVLTDPRGRVQPRVVAAVEALLRRDVEESGVVMLIEPDALAFALVRMGESFLYADVLAAREPDVATADRLQSALLDGTRLHAADGRLARDLPTAAVSRG